MTTKNHSEWPPERIAEVLKYEAKATPGPWSTTRHDNIPGVMSSCGCMGQGDLTFTIRARTDLPSAVREIQRLRGLFLQIMIGGNHLATHLIGSSSKFPNDFKSYEEARDEEGMAYADCWVAWRKIMDARDALDAAKEPAK